VTGEKESAQWTEVRAAAEIEEKFLSAGADHFRRAKWKEKASARSARNDNS
jgi:hypothetical protein